MKYYIRFNRLGRFFPFRKKRESKPKDSWREWGEALLWAIVVTVIMRMVLIEPYRIPTPSMENNLLVGDFVLVTKFSYGIRTPMVLGIPLTDWDLSWFELPWWRIPTGGNPKVGDIVVFDWPNQDGIIASRLNYVKRCVAVPGDKLEIKEGQVYVNGQLQLVNNGVVQTYMVTLKSNAIISPSLLYRAGVKSYRRLDKDTLLVLATKKVVEQLKQWDEVNDLKFYSWGKDQDIFRSSRFNFSRAFKNPHHLESIIIPYKGQKVKLTRKNWNIYIDLVTRHEGHQAQWEGDVIIIDGEKRVDNIYIVEQDYYFMMGDNRDNSEDSRFWGFVPQDHIIGKAWVVFFSWDFKGWPKFDRILTFLH